MAAKLNKDQTAELENKAKIIRRHICEMIGQAQSGHPGGSLSIADILTVLYFHTMKIDPKKPEWEERDRLVLSKGHAAPALYAVLAEKGYFPVSYLKTLRQVGSSLQGHPDMLSLPGIEMSTGSLGQGLSCAIGIALSARLDKKKFQVYCIIGDGESQEGQIWEAAMTASHMKVDNLIAILDHNKLQIDGRVSEVKGIQPINEKWKSFGWNVIEANGHNLVDLSSAFGKAANHKGKPSIIIADTTKGKGVCFMEDNVNFHGKAPNAQELDQALRELS